MKSNNVIAGLLGVCACLLFLIYYEEIRNVMFEQLPQQLQYIAQMPETGKSESGMDPNDEDRQEEERNNATTTATTTTNPRFYTIKSLKDLFDTCPLKHKDPWDDEFIKKLGKANKDSCTPDELLTKFKDGKVELNEKNPASKGHSCQGRCIYYKNNYVLGSDSWKKIDDQKFECDHVEVECKDVNGKVDYKYIHQQIFEYSRDRMNLFGSMGKKTNASRVRSDQFHPDVYIIILDAMSMTGGFRQMPETMIFLEESLQAVPFRFVAKVAENREIPIPVDRRVFGVNDVLHHTLDENESCGRALDNETYIMFEYEDAGYKTMWGCDFYLVNFGYTNCVGIKNQLSTHYMRAFQIRSAYQKDDLLKSFVFNREKCRFPYTHLLDYQQMFIDSYKDVPKMSLIWSVDASHDSEKPMASTDSTFRKFLEQNKHNFDNAFVIVMGDHGPRYDSATNTKQGLYDRINPLMMLALPERLRGSKMHKVLKENSEELSSHHDLHATLVDIVRHQPETNFTDIKYRKINKTYGSSWLRKFESGVPRTCKTLPIPSQYCLCDYGQIEILDSNLHKELGQRAVRDINTFLHERGVADQCEDMEFDSMSKLLLMPSVTYKAQYRVHFITKKGAKLMTTYVRHQNDRVELLKREWDRTDRYGKTADCLKIDAKNFDLRILCYCKKQ
ncbi:unnamed protein product, partial [Mesorhabditis belari]|uniref:Uncharacterized protein n=1 Tax=Mesorhabditis belari TaxID=2138241 RepID=A0AAF3F2K8_9BILA